MNWKPVLSKEERPSGFYCDHNTFSIPNEKVIAGMDEAPKVLIDFAAFSTSDERKNIEILGLIEAMNLQGKFVSRVWLAAKMAMGERAMDRYMTRLKNEKRVVELLAIKDHKTIGHFYRVAGTKIKRKMQVLHGRMRRGLPTTKTRRQKDASVVEQFYCSPKGSLNNKETFPAISSSPPPVQEREGRDLGYGFSQYTRPTRIQRPKLKYPNGDSGDGRNGTAYTAEGCYARFHDEENNRAEAMMLQELQCISYDGLTTPQLCRSLARRVDSGLINPDTIAKLITVIEGKKLSIVLREIVLKFDDLLAEFSDKIIPEELDYLNDRVKDITTGTQGTTVQKDLLRAQAALSTYSLLPSDHDFLTFDSLCATISSDAFPVYAKLLILSKFSNISEKTITDLFQEYEIKLFTEFCENLTIHKLLHTSEHFAKVDWKKFDVFRAQYLGQLRSTFLANRLSNKQLDQFVRQLPDIGEEKYCPIK